MATGPQGATNRPTPRRNHQEMNPLINRFSASQRCHNAEVENVDGTARLLVGRGALKAQFVVLTDIDSAWCWVLAANGTRIVSENDGGPTRSRQPPQSSQLPEGREPPRSRPVVVRRPTAPARRGTNPARACRQQCASLAADQKSQHTMVDGSACRSVRRRGVFNHVVTAQRMTRPTMGPTDPHDHQADNHYYPTK